MLSLTNAEAAVVMVTAVPFVTKLLNEQMKHVIMKELLYMSGNLLSLALTSILILLKNRTVL